jgi:hypothetical protein
LLSHTEITQEQAIVLEVPFGAEPGQMGFMSYTIPVRALYELECSARLLVCSSRCVNALMKVMEADMDDM